jgi:hypothetical protein
LRRYAAAKGGIYIKNSINRYLINSPMLPNMKENKDGVTDALHPEGLTWQG